MIILEPVQRTGTTWAKEGHFVSQPDDLGRVDSVRPSLYSSRHWSQTHTTLRPFSLRSQSLSTTTVLEDTQTHFGK